MYRCVESCFVLIDWQFYIADTCFVLIDWRFHFVDACFVFDRFDDSISLAHVLFWSINDCISLRHVLFWSIDNCISFEACFVFDRLTILYHGWMSKHRIYNICKYRCIYNQPMMNSLFHIMHECQCHICTCMSYIGWNSWWSNPWQRFPSWWQ